MSDAYPDALTRIAAALERLSPPPPPAADPREHAAYAWRSGVLAASGFAAQPIDALVGIDRQKASLVGNLRRLAAGHAAHDVLLWGARGTGKSALVKAGVAAVQADGGDLALVEVGATEVLPAVFAALGSVGRAFAVFVDDLGFDSAGEARALRSMLESGAEARPANVRLLVTSNPAAPAAARHRGAGERDQPARFDRRSAGSRRQVRAKSRVPCA